VNAMLYVVKTGCQWRQVPADFPPWQSVYQQFHEGAALCWITLLCKSIALLGIAAARIRIEIRTAFADYWIVYVTVVTALLVNPGASAIALIVSEELTVIGEV
jgi:hypothetical protein